MSERSDPEILPREGSPAIDKGPTSNRLGRTPDDGYSADRLPSEVGLSKAAKNAIAAGLKPWTKGQSGNPGGYTKLYFRARKLFQDHSQELAQRLIDLALNAEDERVAAMCTITGLGI